MMTTSQQQPRRRPLLPSARQRWVVPAVLGCLALLLAGSASGQCIQDFNLIYEQEELVTDTTVPRTYVVCPNKLYEVGSLDFNYNLRNGPGSGNPPLPLRPNMTLRCGEDGARTNLCWITDGHLHMDGTSVRGITDDTLDNVVIEGFVFLSALQHSLWADKPGSITFRDCEWKDFTRSHGPIMLDYYDDSDRGSELLVEFEDCRFHDNRYFGKGAQTSLVMANSAQTRVVFRRTLFDNNDMTFNNTRPDSTVPDSNTFLIESLGPTSIEDSCFLNNLVQGSGVAVYGNQLLSSNIHAAASAGTLCDFASVFESLQQFETLQPLCVAAMMANCTVIDLPDPDGDNVTLVKHYVPFATNALRYDEAFEVDPTTFEGGCNREGFLPEDGPDAQNTEDEVCLGLGGCHVSHTLPGESLVYRFGHYTEYEVDGSVSVDVTVRVSSATAKRFALELVYGAEVAAFQASTTSGTGGVDTYEDITWPGVRLRASESIHSIEVGFTDGFVNFCSISVAYSNSLAPSPPPTSATTVAAPSAAPAVAIAPVATTTPNSTAPVAAPAAAPVATTTPNSTAPDVTTDEVVVPGLYNAMYFTEESVLDLVDGRRGDCPVRLDSFVDAEINDDAVCAEAVNGYGTSCNIAFTESGEFVVYTFRKDPSQTTVGVTLRTASTGTRQLQVEILSQDGSEQLASYDGGNPATGSSATYNTFTVWDQVEIGTGEYYQLKITFTNGKVNFCSFGIE